MNRTFITLLILLVFFTGMCFAQPAPKKNEYLKSGTFNADTWIRSLKDSITVVKSIDSLAKDAPIYYNAVDDDSVRNWGQDSTGYIGNDTLRTADSLGVGRILIEADTINAIPKDAIIEYVSLEVFRDTTDTIVGTPTMLLFTVRDTANWDEGDSINAVDSVSWIYRKLNAPWDSGGGDYQYFLDSVQVVYAFDSLSTDTLKFEGTLATDSLVIWVQDIVNGTVSNAGVIIKAKMESLTTYYPVVMGEHPTLIGLVPKWTIKYTLPYNYGADSILVIGMDTVGNSLDTARTIIKNDSIQLIPNNATLTDIDLVIYGAVDTSLSINSGWIGLYKLDSAFTEGSGTVSTDNDTASWRYRLKGGYSWNLAGGDFGSIIDSCYADSASDSLHFSGDSLLAHLQRIAVGTDSNMGFILMAINEADTFRWYAQSSDEDTFAYRYMTWNIWYTTPVVPKTHPFLLQGWDGSGRPARISEYDLVTAGGMASSEYKIQGYAGENLTQYDLVYIGVGEDSVFYKADADDTSKMRVIGIVLATATTGQADSVQIAGIFNTGSSWLPGATLYLSTTAGGMTQTVPPASGVYTTAIKKVGVAVRSNQIRLIIDNEVILW